MVTTPDPVFCFNSQSAAGQSKQTRKSENLQLTIYVKDIELPEPLVTHSEGLSMQQVIALGDPIFPDMEDWLNRSDDIEKNKLNAPQAHASLGTKVITISVSAASDANQMDTKQDKLEHVQVPSSPGHQESSMDKMSVDEVNHGMPGIIVSKRCHTSKLFYQYGQDFSLYLTIFLLF